MYPAPSSLREPVIGSHLIPDEIRHAYIEAVTVYNAQAWSATAACCRRTLEGIVSYLLTPESRKGSLAQQLEDLVQSVDLSRPILTLADALRQGGNLGAHFDATSQPNQEVASSMLDLIDYLLEYVFTLPSLVDQFKEKLARSASSKE